MAKLPNKENKKLNPILWFIFAILIPITIVLTLAIIILNVAGIDTIGYVKDKGNNIPILSDVITTDEEKNTEDSVMQYEETIKHKDKEIESLKQTITDLEVTVQKLEEEKRKIESEETNVQRKDTVNQEESKETSSQNESIKNVH